VFMHAPRTMRTPRAMRTHATPDAARSHPMLVCVGGGVGTPNTIRPRTTPPTGFPRGLMFMVARGTLGATRAKRPRVAIDTRTHCAVLPSFRRSLSSAGGARVGRRAPASRGGHGPSRARLHPDVVHPAECILWAKFVPAIKGTKTVACRPCGWIVCGIVRQGSVTPVAEHSARRAER
jgi:hypothetical protein